MPIGTVGDILHVSSTSNIDKYQTSNITEPLKNTPSPVITCRGEKVSSESKESELENPGQIPVRVKNTKVIESV